MCNFSHMILFMILFTCLNKTQIILYIIHPHTYSYIYIYIYFPLLVPLANTRYRKYTNRTLKKIMYTYLIIKNNVYALWIILRGKKWCNKRYVLPSLAIKRFGI